MKDYIETQYKNLDFTIPDDYVSRREVYAMLDYIGGTDADEAYFQGWDAAIDEACSLLNDVDSAMGWTPVEEELPEETGVLLVTIDEPSCGSGGMVVATAQVLQKRGINYQKTLDVVCQDLDWSAVYMCYVQLSLLGIKAIVVQGDTLAEPYKKGYPKERVFYTPAKRGLLI